MYIYIYFYNRAYFLAREWECVYRQTDMPDYVPQ